MNVITILSLIGFPSLSVAVFTWVIARIIKMAKDHKALRLGMQASLRSRLYELYLRCKDKGYANMYERDDFENVYTHYHQLGANGVMDNIREKFLHLPLTEED